MRGRIDPPVADVLRPVRPAVGIQFILVRRAVPAGIDPIRVERHLVVEAVLQNVGHHPRRLVPAARRHGQNRRDDPPLRITRYLVLQHEPMHQRLEFPPRLVLAGENQDGRLTDRLPRHQPEVGPLHADLDVDGCAGIRKPRLPGSRPADREQETVLVVEMQFEEWNVVVRRPSAGRRENLLVSGLDRERFGDEVRGFAGGAAQDVERHRLLGYRLSGGEVQRPEIADDPRRLRLREVGRQDVVF